MLKGKIRKKLLPMAALLGVAAAVGITVATILHQMQLENVIRTPTVEGEVTEKMTGPDGKQVAFKNTGEADVLLRVAYTETWTWTDETTKETIILPNVTMNAIGDPVAPAAPKFIEEEYGTYWEEKADGWTYYKRVLKSGDTTKLLTESVEFADLTALPDSRYSEAVYQLHFTMEVVQASDDVELSQEAAEELFGRDFTGGWTEPSGKYTASITWN